MAKSMGGAKHYTDTTEHTKGAMPRPSAALARDCCQRKKTLVNGNKSSVKMGAKPGAASHQVG